MTYAKLFEIELFDHLIVNKWLMFNWTVSDTFQALKSVSAEGHIFC